MACSWAIITQAKGYNLTAGTVFSERPSGAAIERGIQMLLALSLIHI